MAAVSFSLNRGQFIDLLVAGSQAVTEGTAAPGAGELEVRIADPGTVPWTKNEIERAMDTIFRFLSNPNNSTSIPL